MAYGAIRNRPPLEEPLEARLYPLSSRVASDVHAAVITIPFDIANGDSIDAALEAKLQREFNAEIEGGQTYPQEHLLTAAEFRSYFLASIFILGILLSSEQLATFNLPGVENASSILDTGVAVPSSQLSKIELGSTRLRIYPGASTGKHEPVDWNSKCAFSYYIKPNYPGRSSHLSNAGFVVPSTVRGMGLGQLAGRSFLYYGPCCGYRGSIFNLVYAQNEPSVRIWQRLGFQIIGTIPEAGRLKAKNGTGEEYHDAYIVYGDFKKIGHKNA